MAARGHLLTRPCTTSSSSSIRSCTRGNTCRSTFIPVRPDQLEAYLKEGIGDLIAYRIVVTAGTRAAGRFLDPDSNRCETDRRDGEEIRPVSSLQDLSGKKVFVNPLTTYYDNLQKVNESLRKQGKPPILIEKADKNLMDEDLLEMVNAGILPATVTISSAPSYGLERFPDITPQPKIVIAGNEDLAWAMRRTIRSSSNWWTSGSRPMLRNVVRQHPDAALSAKRSVDHESNDCKRKSRNSSNSRISSRTMHLNTASIT